METRIGNFSSQATGRKTRGGYDGRQRSAIFRDPWHHHGKQGPGIYHPVPKLQEGRQEEVMVGDKDWRLSGIPGTTIRFPSKKGDRRRYMIGDKDWRLPHLVPRLQGGRQEQVLMGDKNWRFPGTPAPPPSSQATRRKTRGGYDWRQGLAISRDHGRQGPVPKLQEERQEEVMLGDRDWRFPGTPGTTILRQSYKN